MITFDELKKTLINIFLDIQLFNDNEKKTFILENFGTPEVQQTLEALIPSNTPEEQPLLHYLLNIATIFHASTPTTTATLTDFLVKLRELQFHQEQDTYMEIMLDDNHYHIAGLFNSYSIAEAEIGKSLLEPLAINTLTSDETIETLAHQLLPPIVEHLAPPSPTIHELPPRSIFGRRSRTINPSMDALAPRQNSFRCPHTLNHTAFLLTGMQRFFHAIFDHDEDDDERSSDLDCS